jgi:TolB-like protein/DNA-binding winged helix-turn-helix (wHTH) protein
METGGTPKLLRFGTFEVDLRTGELRKAGRRVHLQEQPFKILAALLARPGEIVFREELRDRVWSAETFVDFDTALNKAVGKIRDALGDSSTSPRFIETLPRRGYRFIAPVDAVPADTVAVPREKPDEPSFVRVAAVSTDKVPKTVPLARRRKRQLLIACGSTIVFVAAGWAWIAATHARPQFGSIAVLPLRDLSGQPESEFFADGITDQLITELAKIGSLRVISRTSVMHYKSSPKRLREIARELNVGAIVEGSVVRAGNRTRITAQLINAATDEHLWARSYDQGLDDILAVQGLVAHDIATQVNAKLTPGERRDFSKRQTIQLEAHDSYLKGHILLHDDAAASVRYFERAIELDPRYPAAYAGLAEAHFWPAWDWGTAAPSPAFPRGRSAAIKALQLDPESSEGHAALGWVKFFFERDWSGAESEMKESIRLSPNNAWAHHHYSRVLAANGRFDESIREARRMQELDPLDFRSGGNLAWMLYLAHRYDESIRENLRMIHMYPSVLGFQYFLAWNYEAQGRYQEAVDALHIFERSGTAAAFAELGFAYGGLGDQRAANGMLEKLLTRSTQGYVPPFYIALVHLGLRKNDLALAWLEKALEEQSPFLVYLKTEPKLDTLRSDRRFTDLMRRVGFL